ncbi:hypothetical protein SEA_DERPP_66 [Mycobacterium phage Derpp]|uniref:Uncharacterized protein n=2 Tax=Pegunavirus TaxID=1623295 RepID=A0A1C9M0K1_9CAUD|nr:hypothetical protein SEA_DERPP_66 [Mycobacterium phage Derpp]AXC37380.1 hypothetical protein SEA_CRAFF_69 [Mycobacterium phage Craff]AXH69336.1 hypothetical protein SEA_PINHEADLARRY_65 [Mycobacterium phage PinheadLarry]
MYTHVISPPSRARARDSVPAEHPFCQGSISRSITTTWSLDHGLDKVGRIKASKLGVFLNPPCPRPRWPR